MTDSRQILLQQMDAEICLHAWHDPVAQRLLETLCLEIGPRPSGSPGMRRALSYLAEHLASLGAAGIHEEPVSVRSWEPGEPRVELRAPYRRSFTCGQYIFTSPIDATLPLVAREAANLRGAAVLMDGHTVSGSRYVAVRQRLEQVRQAGAAAILLRSTPPTGKPALDVAGMDGDFPLACFGVSREDGEELAAVAGKGQVYLYANGASAPAQCANLVADLGPDEYTETLILGAHLDSYWNAPGAGDNLTGVVTMLEVARLLAPFRAAFRRRLHLVAFTGEELGCLGSRAYVAAHREELARIPCMLNMDTLFPATARGMAVVWRPELRDYIEAAFREAHRQVDVRNLFCMSSDYFPFMLAGLPVARPADWENSLPMWWHSELDDLRHIRADWVQHNAMVYTQLLGRMLTDPSPLPVRHLSIEEVQARLEAEDIGEWMVAQGFDWPLLPVK